MSVFRKSVALRFGIEVIGVSLVVLGLMSSRGLSRGVERAHLEVKVETDSTVRAGDKLYEGKEARTGEDGYIMYRFKPWYNPNIEQYACTDLRVAKLRSLGVGVNLKLEYKGIIFCPYKGAIRIISPNYKSPKSQVNIESKLTNGILVGATFKQGEGQYSYDKNNLPMVGNLRGKEVVISTRVLVADHREKVGNRELVKRREIGGREYRKVGLDGNIGEGREGLYPFLRVRENRGNGRVRLCSDVDNQVMSLVKKSLPEREEESCIETVVGDRVRVLNPLGESVIFRVKFKEE